jgi:hypothetical protein
MFLSVHLMQVVLCKSHFVLLFVSLNLLEFDKKIMLRSYFVEFRANEDIHAVFCTFINPKPRYVERPKFAYSLLALFKPQPYPKPISL